MKHYRFVLSFMCRVSDIRTEFIPYTSDLFQTPHDAAVAAVHFADEFRAHHPSFILCYSEILCNASLKKSFDKLDKYNNYLHNELIALYHD